MAPLVLYALMGSSGALAVGPAAVTSLMTAASVGAIAAQGSVAYTEAALMLALVSGALMLVMGALRLGFLAHFLSHPVISGFVSASGLLIAASQLKHLLGVPLQGETLLQLLPNLFQQLPHVHWPTVLMGVGALGLLVLARQQLKPALKRWGVAAGTADVLSKAAPVAVLFGPRTGSSGEASVLAWRGRPQTRSFGQPTAGVSTGNVVQTLADGSRLLLTTTVMRDRNDRGDGLKIEPDQRIEGDAATLAAAEAWLLAQPACQGR